MTECDDFYSRISRLGWRSKALTSPSILSHLTDPSLLPPHSSKSNSYITCYAPASGHHLSTIPSASKEEIALCITRADFAQRRWSETTFAERRRVLRSLLEWCVRDMEAIARVASRDTGKTSACCSFVYFGWEETDIGNGLWLMI